MQREWTQLPTSPNECVIYRKYIALPFLKVSGYEFDCVWGWSSVLGDAQHYHKSKDWKLLNAGRIKDTGSVDVISILEWKTNRISGVCSQHCWNAPQIFSWTHFISTIPCQWFFVSTSDFQSNPNVILTCAGRPYFCLYLFPRSLQPFSLQRQ